MALVSFPPLTRFFHRCFHFAKPSWIASFEMAFIVRDEFALMSSILQKRRLFSIEFNFGNKKKSHILQINVALLKLSFFSFVNQINFFGFKAFTVYNNIIKMLTRFDHEPFGPDTSAVINTRISTFLSSTTNTNPITDIETSEDF